jgi:hypothetical protein
MGVLEQTTVTDCIVDLKYWFTRSFWQLMKLEVNVKLDEESSKIVSCERVLFGILDREIVSGPHLRRVVISSGYNSKVNVEHDAALTGLCHVAICLQLKMVSPGGDTPWHEQRLRLLVFRIGIER